MNYNERITKIQPSEIRRFAELFAQIDGLLSFTIGEPDFNIPEKAKVAFKKSIDNNESGYASSKGDPKLIEAIVNYYNRKQGLNLNPEQIIITNGVSQGMKTGIETLINPGDKVIVQSPFFGPYENCISLAGGIPVMVDTSGDGFKLTSSLLRKTLEENPETKLLVLNYPNNPLGTTYTKGDIIELAKVIKEFDIYVMSDEIYSDLIYDFDHYSIFHEIPEKTILLNGVSKTYAMTGLRVGFIHLPEELYTPYFIAHQTTVTCVATPNQRAAEAAYNECDSDVEETRLELKRRRDLLLSGLEEVGMECVKPAGAFYAFPKIPQAFKGDDKEFAVALAENAKVGVIPGSVFGPGGEGHVRISYATKYENIEEAIKRVKAYVETL